MPALPSYGEYLKTIERVGDATLGDGRVDRDDHDYHGDGDEKMQGFTSDGGDNEEKKYGEQPRSIPYLRRSWLVLLSVLGGDWAWLCYLGTVDAKGEIIPIIQSNNYRVPA